MMFRFIPPLALLALAAQPLVAKPHYPPSTGQSSLYACADGRTIEVLYSGGDAVVITLGDDSVQLARAVAASGERYVGGGWQWWGKGRRDGMLSPIAAGEATASAPGADCHVR